MVCGWEEVSLEPPVSPTTAETPDLFIRRLHLVDDTHGVENVGLVCFIYLAAMRSFLPGQIASSRP